METVRIILKPLFSRLPRRVQVWTRSVRERRWMRAEAQRNFEAVRRGHRLVPEAALERKYIEALACLTNAGLPLGELGDYLEFGVYNGSSLACAYRALDQAGASHVRLFGFDSFEGLPPHAKNEDEGVWQPGQFRMDQEFARKFLSEQGVQSDRVTLVKGWFSDTLTEELLQRHAITRASLIMIDCDMYSSAKTALTFCAPLIRDRAVVFFDDWSAGDLAARNMGEKRAFDEFLEEHPELTAEEFGDYGGFSKVFIVARG